MKKRKGISLIETLISLTIVGISMVALLPVVTIKKDGLDKSYGNKYWELATDGGYVPNGNKNVAIGIDAQTTKPLYVYNRGFANNAVHPLKVTEQLEWNNMRIDKATNGFHIKSGTPASIGGAGSVATATTFVYPRGIFLNDKVVVLENHYNELDSNTKFFAWAEKGTSMPSGVRDSSNYYSIINGDEYLVVDKTNQVIGIGRNAARYYKNSGQTNDTLKDFIAIFNNNYTGGSALTYPALEDVTTSGTTSGTTITTYPKGGLIIGLVYDKKFTGYSGDATVKHNFVIHRIYNEDFTVNANLVANRGFKAGAVIIPSDKRLKDILYDYNKSINEITKVKPVNFTYKNDKNKIQHTGVIAQDLKKIFPEAVSKNQTDGYLMITEDPVFYALLNAIKALDEKNNSLKKENDELEKKVLKLREIRDSLKASQGGSDEK